MLHLYAMDQYSIGQCMLAMAGITAAFTVLGYVVLKYVRMCIYFLVADWWRCWLNCAVFDGKRVFSCLASTSVN